MVVESILCSFVIPSSEVRAGEASRNMCKLLLLPSTMTSKLLNRLGSGTSEVLGSGKGWHSTLLARSWNTPTYNEKAKISQITMTSTLLVTASPTVCKKWLLPNVAKICCSMTQNDTKGCFDYSQPSWCSIWNSLHSYPAGSTVHNVTTHNAHVACRTSTTNLLLWSCRSSILRFYVFSSFINFEQLGREVLTTAEPKVWYRQLNRIIAHFSKHSLYVYVTGQLILNASEITASHDWFVMVDNRVLPPVGCHYFQCERDGSCQGPYCS